MAWTIAPLAILWDIWREKNKRAFEGVEMSFIPLISSLLFLLFFWCPHEVVYCI